jgi:hypothetical protein
MGLLQKQLIMKRVLVAFILFATCSVLFPSLTLRAMACEGCFYECNNYTKKIGDLNEPEKSIALALWFGDYSSQAKPNCVPRSLIDYPKPDPNISQYLEFWNSHLSHISISEEERDKQRYPEGLESIKLPLPSASNSVFIYIARKHLVKNQSRMDFVLDTVTIESTSDENECAKKINIQLFAADVIDVGGARESSLGLMKENQLKQFLDQTITIKNRQPYDLGTKQHLRDYCRNRYPRMGIAQVGMVLKISVLNEKGTSHQDCNANLIISRNKEIAAKKDEESSETRYIIGTWKKEKSMQEGGSYPGDEKWQLSVTFKDDGSFIWNSKRLGNNNELIDEQLTGKYTLEDSYLINYEFNKPSLMAQQKITEYFAYWPNKSLGQQIFAFRDGYLVLSNSGAKLYLMLKRDGIVADANIRQ